MTYPPEVENAFSTYRTLSLALPGSEPFETGSSKGVLGPYPHALGAFAFLTAPDPWEGRRLATLSTERPQLHVYVPDDAALVEVLHRAGFIRTYRLVTMSASGTPGPPLPPLRQGLLAQRMAEAIFAAQPKELRKAIAEALTQTPALELYGREREGQIEAVAMLHATKGLTGLYNLWVEPHRRRRGIGAEMVKALLGVAASRQHPLTLQCEPRLEEWYQSLGFRRIGGMDGFTFGNSSKR